MIRMNAYFVIMNYEADNDVNALTACSAIFLKIV